MIFNGVLTLKKVDGGWHSNLIPTGFLYMHSAFGFTLEQSLENLYKHIETVSKK